MRDPDDPSIVQHAQFWWRDNGGIMFGSDRDGGVGPATGVGCCNIVVASDEEVDATLQGALVAGGTPLNDVNEPPHGGRNVAVSDPEGNIWNIDSSTRGCETPQRPWSCHRGFSEAWRLCPVAQLSRIPATCNPTSETPSAPDDASP